ncbi:MAG: phage adaptor protein [Planctomycetota bacterium]|jgi:hypothetical protein
MAIITNYATLQTAVADYLARDDLTTFVPNFIQNCENKLRRTLNLRNEETALSVNVSSGVAAVPADFKKLKFAYYDATPVYLLQWVPIEELYRDFPDRSTNSATPSVISREGANFVFGPVAADSTAALKGIYYAKQDPLRTTDPSWYATNAPEVLLYGSLLEAEPFIHNDARLPVWQTLYTDAVRSLIDENDNAETSAGQLIQRVS